jgi:hypothetical protein
MAKLKYDNDIVIKLIMKLWRECAQNIRALIQFTILSLLPNTEVDTIIVVAALYGAETLFIAPKEEEKNYTLLRRIWDPIRWTRGYMRKIV